MKSWQPRISGRLSLRAQLRRPWRFSPPALLALSFLALILIGGLLLWLPMASHGGLGLGQALFTACSAVTVTGLVVVDTGSVLTGFGQAVVLVLIHLGGLGLMTFAGLTILALGGRLGLGGRRVVREALDQTAPGDVLVLVRHIAILALSLELVGALLLALVWVPEMGWGEGLWFSVFHAVSAFNNAGFGLRPDSLMPWAGQPLVNVVITALFITGGLGFTVILDLWRRRRFARLTLHSKLTLAGTAILALGGWLLMLGFEWRNPDTLGALPVADRLWAAWFTAVTPRTAGFNSVDTGALGMPATLLTMMLMFIGGGSNSTASGVKVTTFMVVLLSTRAILRGEQQPRLFRRAVALAAVFRAYAVVMLSVMLLMLAGFVLVILQPQMRPLDVLFESFSAFGTVGLSRGITAQIGAPGQGILMLLMFVGRIGPLAFAYALARPNPARVRYTEAEVQIG